MQALTKLVITNRLALLHKYRRGGYRHIRAALRDLMRADAERGIRVELAFIDGPTVDDTAAGNAVIQRQWKRAVDELYLRFDRPDYLMFIGGPDVVPFQALVNPCAAFGDWDAYVSSDLPYACDQGYGTSIESFRTPSRVVGRLPDLPGATDARELIRLIGHARSAQPLDNGRCFALSSRSCKGAAQASLGRSFPAVRPVVWSAPPAGPTFIDSWLERSYHFVNCLGRAGHADLFAHSGKAEDEERVAIGPESIHHRLGRTVVAAVTSSYAGRLQAAGASAAPTSMGMAYLTEGAAAVLASPSATYGGNSTPDASCAELLCAEFLARVAAGASSGRAFLEALQSFIAGTPLIDPFQLKTMGQFVLYGDPSYSAHADEHACSVRTPATLSEHRRRRKRLAAIGQSLKHRTRVLEVVDADATLPAFESHFLHDASATRTPTTRQVRLSIASGMKSVRACRVVPGASVSQALRPLRRRCKLGRGPERDAHRFATLTDAADDVSQPTVVGSQHADVTAAVSVRETAPGKLIVVVTQIVDDRPISRQVLASR